MTELSADAAAWIEREVIRRFGAPFGPHHAPIWGNECRRCPPPICPPCSTSRRDQRWDFHDQCTGLSWAAYSESEIWWPDRERIDQPQNWVDGPWQLWVKPRPCECGCDPAEHETSWPAAPRQVAIQLGLFTLA